MDHGSIKAPWGFFVLGCLILVLALVLIFFFVTSFLVLVLCYLLLVLPCCPLFLFLILCSFLLGFFGIGSLFLVRCSWFFVLVLQYLFLVLGFFPCSWSLFFVPYWHNLLTWCNSRITEWLEKALQRSMNVWPVFS